MKALLAQLACRIGDVAKFSRPTRPVTVLEKDRAPA